MRGYDGILRGTNTLNDYQQRPICLNLQVCRLTRLFTICGYTQEDLPILAAHREQLGRT